jgi:hypothetical protein
MPNINEYWAKVRELREKLKEQYPDGYCFLVSMHKLDKNTKGGIIVQVSVDRAAELLADDTHRPPTKDELAAYQSAQERERERINAAELRKVKQNLSVELMLPNGQTVTAQPVVKK